MVVPEKGAKYFPASFIAVEHSFRRGIILCSMLVMHSTVFEEDAAAAADDDDLEDLEDDEDCC